TFGSISVERKRVKKPGFAYSICASFVWSTTSRATLFRPSIVFRSFGSDGEITSMTLSLSASPAVRFDAFRTAASAHLTLRPWDWAGGGGDGAVALAVLGGGRLPIFGRLERIGVDEPMFVFGAIASTSAAWEIHTPAEAARAPSGDT